MIANYLMTGIILIAACTALADENIKTDSELTSLGYTAVEKQDREKMDSTSVRTASGFLYPAHSLAWPISFASAAEQIGNTMLQYQPFLSPGYFHGGADLRTTTRAVLTTPVSGRLEAGHYGYSANGDGTLKKYWKPWPQRGDSMYFELAVVDESGHRFEFHHVDRSRLPQEIRNRLNRPNPTVTVGEALGYAVRFPRSYTHIHYNIIGRDGARLNPEHYSPLIPDDRAPDLHAVFAVHNSGDVEEVRNNSLHEVPSELVVYTSDFYEKGPYEHPPVKTRVETLGGRVIFQWNFSQKLQTDDNGVPHLFDIFAGEITGSEGRRYKTDGGYGAGKSLIRLPLDNASTGEQGLRLVLEDAAGNFTTQELSIEEH